MLPIAHDSLEHSSPTDAPQHSISHSSHLEAVPDELLTAIFEQLVCFNSGHPFSPKCRPCISRKNFHSLCLVSKRIDLIARPYLYHTVYIEHTGTLMKLCRTLAGDKSLTEHFRAISLCIGDLDEIAKLDSAKREKLRDACYQHIGGCIPQMSQDVRTECDLIGILCYKLLAWAVNLSSLVLGVDTTLKSGLIGTDGAHSRDLERRGLLCHQNLLAFFSCVIKDATRSAVGRGDAAFLPQLEALAIEAIGGHHSGAMSAEVFQPFLNLPSLRTVRSAEDDGNWSRLSSGPELFAPLPHLHDQRRTNWNITTLDLSVTRACQYDIEDIVRLFPCLEVLAVVNDSYNSSHRLEHHAGRDSRMELSSALEKLTALRTLKIAVYPTWAVPQIMYENITADLGPSKVLSLVRLQNLQRLEVPVYMLARPGELYDGARAVPREVLPKSLRTLVLLATHGCKRGCLYPGKLCLDQMEAAVEFLESLGDDLAYFPHLNSVAHCYMLGCSFPGSFEMHTTWLAQGEEAAEYSTSSRLEVTHALFRSTMSSWIFEATSPAECIGRS